MEQWNDGILGLLVLHLVEKEYGSWTLPAIALDTLPLIWELLLFSEALSITMTSTGMAGG